MTIDSTSSQTPAMPTTTLRSSTLNHIRVWLDLDNSPHVLLFNPLIRRLKADGCVVLVTARDFAQTLDLVHQLKIDALPVGAHAGRSKLRKVLNLPVRARQLMRAVHGFQPQLALSHGSRTQTLAARMMGIPSVVMFDYEWTDMRVFRYFATRLLCPSVITPARLKQAGIPVHKTSFYEGFKEDLYLPEFRPDSTLRSQLNVGPDDRLVTIRPPGIVGNYHDSRSEEICRRLLHLASADPANVVVVLPKTRVERQLVEQSLPADQRARVMIPDRALPGLQLIYGSDLVISGGGTMNREAALLGVPAYSMFTGRRGAVDDELKRIGLLKFLQNPGDLDGIEWRRRLIDYDAPPRRPSLMDELVMMLPGFINQGQH